MTPRRRPSAGGTGVGERGVLSDIERSKRRIRWSVRGVHGLLLAFLVVAGLGPLLWLAKSSVSTTQDTLRHPMSLWPSGIDLENLSVAWNEAEMGHYFFNTVKVALGVVAGAGRRRRHRRLRARHPQAVVRADRHRPRAGDAVHPAGRAPRPAVRDRARPAVRRVVAAQQLLGRVAAGGRERVQRPARQAVLREHPDRAASRRPASTAPDRSGCCGRSCCRCRGRSSASCRCSPSSPRGRTSCGRSSCSPSRRCSRCRCACRPSAARCSSTCSSPPLLISTVIPVGLFLVCQRFVFRGAGLSGAVKG